jgi:hypothetical protein
VIGFLIGGMGNGFLKISLYSGLNHLLSPAVTVDIKVMNDATSDKLLKAIIKDIQKTRTK